MIVLTTTIIALAIAFIVASISLAVRITAVERNQWLFAKALVALHESVAVLRLIIRHRAEPEPE